MRRADELAREEPDLELLLAPTHPVPGAVAHLDPSAPPSERRTRSPRPTPSVNTTRAATGPHAPHGLTTVPSPRLPSARGLSTNRYENIELTRGGTPKPLRLTRNR